MILVDSSVWIDHLRSSNRELQALLDVGEVLTHEFVIGEIACGSMKNRARFWLCSPICRAARRPITVKFYI